MLVGSSDGNIALIIHRIIRTQISKCFKDAVAYSCISHRSVDDEVDKTFFGVAYTSDDESA